MTSISRFRFNFTLSMATLFLILASCGAELQTLPDQTRTYNESVSGLETPINSEVVTLTEEHNNPTSTPTVDAFTATSLPTITFEALTATPSLEPTPHVIEVECGKERELPRQIRQPDIDVRFSHIAVGQSRLYIAAGQYVGEFDISNPKQPKLVGFWELQDLIDISNISIQGGIAYVTSGSSLYLLNLTSECKFETIVTVEMPFEIFHLELETERVFIGGYSELGGQLQIKIFSNKDLPILHELGTIDLEPAIWSVSDLAIFSLGANDLIVTDTSDLRSLQSYALNVIPSSITNNISSLQIIKDKIYILSGAGDFRLITNLEDGQPTTYHNSKRYLLTGIFEIQQRYVFLGTLGCEGSEVNCGSVVYILNANNAEEITSLAFHSYGEIFNYQEVDQDIVYAFSATSLIIIDLSNTENPTTIGEIRFAQ